MRFRAADAYQLLPRVDPGRLLAGQAVGLRDGALLALIAAGLTAAEISALRASAITMVEGQVQVAIQDQGITWTATLPSALGARLLAWLSECRLWAEDELVFTGRRGPLSLPRICKILHHYRTCPPGRVRRKRKKQVSRSKRRSLLNPPTASEVLVHEQA
jgi:site-specific recombinase XerC